MKHPLRKIVVGTSLDLASDKVVKAALQLRGKSQAELYLVHGSPLPKIEVDRTQVGDQLSRVGATEEDFAKIFVQIGTGDHLLLEVADEFDADLIVVGASETAPSLQPFLGSTADRLLRRSTRPVLVVRGEFVLPKHVLAPTDLSELSAASMTHGFDLIEQLGDQPEVDILFVFCPLDRESIALESFETFVGRLPERKGKTANVLRGGNPREEVLQYLVSHPGIDLVLLGTHGRRGFERFLLGSVASGLLRRIEVSALVVPPEVKEAD